MGGEEPDGVAGQVGSKSISGKGAIKSCPKVMTVNDAICFLINSAFIKRSLLKGLHTSRFFNLD